MVMEEYDLLLLQRGRRTTGEEISAVDAFINSVDSHVDAESEFLHEYSDAIRAHNSPLVRFVLELILQDEEKHHQLLEQVTRRLKADLSFRSTEPNSEPMETIGNIDIPQMIRLTEKFLREERDGIKKMQGILSQAEPFYDGLLVMILKMLVKDSEKHILMLEFLRTKLQKQ
ncbi:MAG: hypothetical protein LT082_07760 [Comamonas sp.]|nr:hypothetical protein [Comamonas sp.]